MPGLSDKRPPGRSPDQNEDEPGIDALLQFSASGAGRAVMTDPKPEMNPESNGWSSSSPESEQCSEKWVVVGKWEYCRWEVQTARWVCVL